MSLVLHCPENKTLCLDKAELSIGSDPSGDLYLPYSGISLKHVVIKVDSGLTWLIRPSDSSGNVHVNARLVHAATLLNAGDDVHFDTVTVHVKSSQQNDTHKIASNSYQATHFNDRMVLRVLTGSETGKAYSLVNSLCIGRSSLSEIQVDDFSMAERQILIQRQGNDVIAKNLSPVLEMRVNGWVCNEAVLTVDSQLSIDQHRFKLQSSCPDFTQTPEAAVPEANLQETATNSNIQQATSNPAIFSRAQWILLASALFISGLLIVLLTIAP
jgi:pSer/pThr/pTyr-binding forkhead associated (FHA) protein